jgi:hypothetical protein
MLTEAAPLVSCHRCGTHVLQPSSVQCVVCRAPFSSFELETPGYSAMRSMTLFSQQRPMSAWTRNEPTLRRLHGAAVVAAGAPATVKIQWTDLYTAAVLDARFWISADGYARLLVRCASSSSEVIFPLAVSSCVYLLHPSDPHKDKALGGVVLVSPAEYFTNERQLSPEVFSEFSLCGVMHLAVKFPEPTDSKSMRQYRRL